MFCSPIVAHHQDTSPWYWYQKMLYNR